MKKRLLKEPLLALGLALGSGLLSCESAAERVGPSGVSVEPGVTWASPGKPEVHLLFQNQESFPVEFTLWMGMIPGGGRTVCKGDLRGADPDFSARFSGWNGLSRGVVRGLVPAGGWTHRSIALGAIGLLPPCDVPYRLDLQSGGSGDERREGVISVGAPEWPPRGTASEDSIEAQAMVETDEIHDGRLIVRVLARNREQHPVFIMVRSKHLACPGNQTLTWALRDAALQGEDVGPYRVPSGGWGVFASAVEAGDAKTDECHAVFQLAAQTTDGIEALGSIEVPLVPTGFFAGLHSGR